MKVMTLNIWNYTRPWKERRDLIAELIERHRPQAVALQETRHDFRYERGKGQGEQLAELTGYHAAVAVGQVYLPLLRVDEALTILTAEPPARIMHRALLRLPRERADENQRVCLGVLLQIQGHDVFVFNTHFSLSARARLSNSVEAARYVMEESQTAPALLMGDLNAEPQADSIRYLHGDFRLKGETADFFDCWTSAHPELAGFTYASFSPVRRIDYVFARNLPPRGVSATIVGGESSSGIYPSDHMGLVVEFSL